MSEPVRPSRVWWKEAVVYQIYPISFYDSNGDGYGDLNGISLKLDYLKDLGVDVIWLSPIYRSPLADMGYDISDYQNIDTRYGTLEDWDNLLKRVHDRGMKLMMDMVLNHTSDEHGWFIQSRSGKSNPKRDWYFWRPPKYDSSGNRGPPNNWKSNFQGSAWEFDDLTQEYYLHLYAKKQPDLNWDNPEAREAAFNAMRFWIKKGCDGFRMDAITLVSKPEDLGDVPITLPGEEYQPASMYVAHGPRIHQYMKDMHADVLSEGEVLTVGEMSYTLDPTKAVAYAIPPNTELDMIIQFDMMRLDSGPLAFSSKKWSVPELKETVERWQHFKRDEGFWNTIFIENHDNPRAVSRFGNDSNEWRGVTAKLIAILQIAQGGTQIVYQGQELGMRNAPRSWGIEEFKDIASQNYWKQKLAEQKNGAEIDMEEVLDNIHKKARDHARVPMQWDSTVNAGFSTGSPWMRVNDDYPECNVATQVSDSNSVHSFYKEALRIRKRYEVLIYGDFKDISTDDASVFALIRNDDRSSALIVLNLKEEEADFDVGPYASNEWRKVLSNYKSRQTILSQESSSILHLKGYEGIVYISV